MLLEVLLDEELSELELDDEEPVLELLKSGGGGGGRGGKSMSPISCAVLEEPLVLDELLELNCSMMYEVKSASELLLLEAEDPLKEDSELARPRP